MSQSVFADDAFSSDAHVRASLAGAQSAFQKARGSSALAMMIAEGYVTIRKIITNTDAKTQAAILDEYGVAVAASGTSRYTPWIKVQWGEPHLDKETFIDSQGNQRIVWVPDRSMEIYHHAMEDLEARGIETTNVQVIADAIMSSGGAAKMSQDRKRRLSGEARDSATAVYENKRKTFLEETKGPMVDIPLKRPEGHGEFMTLLVRAVKDSEGYEVLGIVSPNAVKDLDKMAASQSDAIQARIKARKDEADRAKRDEQIREEERNRTVGGLNRAERLALIRKIAEANRADKTAAQSSAELNAA